MVRSHNRLPVQKLDRQGQFPELRQHQGRRLAKQKLDRQSQFPEPKLDRQGQFPEQKLHQGLRLAERKLDRQGQFQVQKLDRQGQFQAQKHRQGYRAEAQPLWARLELRKRRKSDTFAFFKLECQTKYPFRKKILNFTIDNRTEYFLPSSKNPSSFGINSQIKYFPFK